MKVFIISFGIITKTTNEEIFIQPTRTSIADDNRAREGTGTPLIFPFRQLQKAIIIM